MFTNLPSACEMRHLPFELLQLYTGARLGKYSRKEYILWGGELNGWVEPGWSAMFCLVSIGVCNRRRRWMSLPWLIIDQNMSNHDYHLINDEDSLLKSSNNNHQDFYQNYLSSVQVPILPSNTAANNVMASLMNRKVSLKQLTNGNKLQAPFVNVQPAMVMNYR